MKQCVRLIVVSVQLSRVRGRHYKVTELIMQTASCAVGALVESEAGLSMNQGPLHIGQILYWPPHLKINLFLI